MNLLEKTNQKGLDGWLACLRDGPLVTRISRSAAFKRLEKVSFLGALDHVGPHCKLPRRQRSRADHSLHVAALAAYVASERHYSEELKRHLVVAVLLHDIGHAPLSHSVEPFFRQKLGLGHHEMGEQLLRGKHQYGRELDRIQSRHVDTEFLIRLIDGKVSREQSGDLFASRINIDTIEGITRTYRYFSGDDYSLNPLRVARASFLMNDDKRYQWLDRFWKLKNRVYACFINQKIGLMADHFSRTYFESDTTKLDESALLEDESSWLQRYGGLFRGLNRMHSRMDPPRELEGVSIQYVQRQYSIDPAQQGEARYRQQKTKRIARLTSGSAVGFKCCVFGVRTARSAVGVRFSVFGVQ